MTKQHMKHGGRILAAGLGMLTAVAAFGTASADSYPDKPITFIVPYSPGGGSDQQARRLQPGLEEALGVDVRIVYKTGGGGAVGFNELWRSKADGYTISNVVVPNVVISAKGKDVGFSKPRSASAAAGKPDKHSSDSAAPSGGGDAAKRYRAAANDTSKRFVPPGGKASARPPRTEGRKGAGKLRVSKGPNAVPRRSKSKA